MPHTRHASPVPLARVTTASLRRILKALAPPGLLALRRRWLGWQWFRGDYPDWDAALRVSCGYDDAKVFAAVLASARAVRDARGLVERDGVLVSGGSEPNLPLMACLLRQAAANAGRLRVLDYGGALGSLWWQHESWLRGVHDLHWNVVEQAHVVAAGQREFSVGPLRFYLTLDDVIATDGRPDVVVLSSVLAYLREPDQLLVQLQRLQVPQIVIDRTGFVREGRRRLVVQHVPPRIYPGSYPAWIFDAELLRALKSDYRCEATWSAIDRFDPSVDFRGMSFVRKDRCHL